MYEFVFKFRHKVYENNATMTVTAETLEEAEKKVTTAIGITPTYLYLTTCKEL